MITVRIKGGLGNQLFQYAAAYALAKRTGQPLAADLSFYENQSLRGYRLNELNIEEKGCAQTQPGRIRICRSRYLNKALRILHFRSLPLGKGGRYILESGSGLVRPFFHVKTEDAYLDGYFQSELYFREYAGSLRKQFTPAYPPEEEYLRILEEITRTNSVAVHVRRGDFVKDLNRHHYLLGESYYRRAMEMLASKVTKPVYYWFSDDIEWVKSQFGEREDFRFVRLSTVHPDIDELLLMKACRHIITANSTFSWWAAWLNEHEDALRLCPARRYGIREMIPVSWIRIPVE